jgi:hypothetical protein
VFGDLRRGQRAVLIEGQQAVQLGSAHLVLLVQLLGIELFCLYKSTDLKDNLLYEVRRGLGSRLYMNMI